MSQYDILNPTPTHPLNPDYGFQKKRPLTHLNAKANQGSPYFREITDTGHSFSLSWNDKLKDDARKLKWYYEQYRDGFFTLIDHEGGGRHYVGRFTTPVEPAPTGHNRWSIQQVQFDEIPLAPMLQYPDDWNNDAIWRLSANDFGDRMVAIISGTNWVFEAPRGWTTKSAKIFLNNNPAVGDSVSYVYAGYGFQFWGGLNSGGAPANVLLDGTVVGTANFNGAYGGSSPPLMLLQVQNVPLGIHTVTLQATSATAGNAFWWDALKVMR